MFNKKELSTMANAARLLALEAIQTAGSGHVGAALGFADVITTLFANHLRFDPLNGEWSERDRFILSPGHASALLYAVLHLAGYPVPRKALKSFRRIGGLPGHPELNPRMGVEMTTGPLGQGVASAVGVAMACPDSKVYAAASDGDLMEGVALEAAAFASVQNLGNLIVLWDDNGITIDGPAADANIPARFQAMGWEVITLDGMNPSEIDNALGAAVKAKRPVLLACKTIIGYGCRDQGTSKAHGAPLDEADAAEFTARLSRDLTAGADLWAKLANSKAGKSDGQSGREAEVKVFSMPAATPRDYATRELFNLVMKAAVSANPNLIIGGSADLGASTGAKVGASNYINYGVREHAMGAIMNGLALCGMRPYGSTFLAFSDYMRPAARLAAMMNLPVLFVFSHDSIALGEDGPTHQPIEQLPSLRLIPNLAVLRPCNLREVFLCLKHHFASGGPSAIITSRQAFPSVPDCGAAASVSGYIVAGDKGAKVKLFASGSEVALALAVREILAAKKITAAVISAPSLELLKQEFIQMAAGAFSVWIEASAQTSPLPVSMAVRIDGFGASDRGDAVYARFGFDAAAIAKKIITRLS